MLGVAFRRGVLGRCPIAAIDHSIEGAGGDPPPRASPLFSPQARRAALDPSALVAATPSSPLAPRRGAARRFLSASGRNAVAMDLRMAAVAMCPRYGQAGVLSQHRQCEGDGGPILVAAMERDAW
jgi:hypothetical protein